MISDILMKIGYSFLAVGIIGVFFVVICVIGVDKLRIIFSGCKRAAEYIVDGFKRMIYIFAPKDTEKQKNDTNKKTEDIEESKNDIDKKTEDTEEQKKDIGKSKKVCKYIGGVRRRARESKKVKERIGFPPFLLGVFQQGKKKRIKLIKYSLICIGVGIIFLFIGYYFGYAAVGKGFWMYEKRYPDISTNQVWDRINEDGQFVASDGNTYTYYILVSGAEISLSGEQYFDLEELKSRLSTIEEDNRVILIDSFAIASAYHSVELILNECGIEYEETR